MSRSKPSKQQTSLLLIHTFKQVSRPWKLVLLDRFDPVVSQTSYSQCKRNRQLGVAKHASLTASNETHACNYRNVANNDHIQQVWPLGPGATPPTQSNSSCPPVRFTSSCVCLFVVLFNVFSFFCFRPWSASTSWCTSQGCIRCINRASTWSWCTLMHLY